MKNLISIFFVLCWMHSNAQFRNEMNFPQYLEVKRSLFHQVPIPAEMKTEVKEVTQTTSKKGKTTFLKYVFDEKGRIIAQQENAKSKLYSKVDYGENGRPIHFIEVKNGKVNYESNAIFDQQNRLKEQEILGKKGKFKRKTVLEYGDSDCPTKVENYFDSPTKITSTWENSYYSACDKKNTVLKNAKGKIIQTWTYDCNAEGQLLTPKKDVIQICKWDEETEKYLIKVTQDFDEKGKIRKKVEKYYKSDTSLIEQSYSNVQNELTYRCFYSKDPITGNVTRKVENFRKGVVHSTNTYVQNGKNRIYEDYIKKGKLVRKVVSKYQNGNCVSREIYDEKGLKKSVENNYENNQLVAVYEKMEGNKVLIQKLTYNEKGLLTKKSNYNEKGKEISTIKFAYLYQ